MVGILITWLVTTISFLIISRLPIGVEIDTFGKAAISAAVFGILNALLKPILGFFTFPFILLSFGLFLFVLEDVLKGLTWVLKATLVGDSVVSNPHFVVVYPQ
ncbi:phage holin family protein [Trichocoleus sp. ST-U3]|uniref:phage holin family protein n=1 Tax=Coleofasciculus sp. FACHB-542 TaxID=2692787 RepID=UPI001687EF1D|nr:phage holin family protein [Coleofasciculus sp. FACHB-542]MBD2087583.1 phage holin family protein [Coleofasciculus sp. FACHB-542]